MPEKKIVVFDPKSNEYLYDVLMNLPKDQKRELNRGELNKIRNPGQIKRFVTNEMLDKKVQLWTKLGMDWALVFFDPNSFDISQIEKVYKQYAVEGQPFDQINQMIREKTFVVGSKTIALGLSMMESNCHGETWSINRNFFKVRDSIRHIANISKNVERNQNVEYLAAEQTLKMISRMVYSAMGLDNYLSAVAALQPVDLMILILLFQKPHNFHRVDVLQRKLHHQFKPATVATRTRKLFEAGYLEKIPTANKKPAYQIKSKGVLALSDILNRLVNDAQNEI